MNDCKEIRVNGIQEFMGIEIPVIEGGFGADKRCILVKDIAEIHEMKIKKINELIKNNLDEFEMGVDILEMLGVLSKDTQIGLDLGFSQDAINSMIGKEGKLYVLSERGYIILSMLMRTDKAKDIRKKFVREYFAMREQMVKMAEHIKVLEENALLKDSCNKLTVQSDYYKNDAEQQKRHIEALTAERNEFNIACDIPVRELKKDIKAFMSMFVEDKTDHIIRRGNLYDSYVYSRRRRGVHPNIAQFEQIVVDLQYSFNGAYWVDLKLNSDMIK